MKRLLLIILCVSFAFTSCGLIDKAEELKEAVEEIAVGEGDISTMGWVTIKVKLFEANSLAPVKNFSGLVATLTQGEHSVSGKADSLGFLRFYPVFGNLKYDIAFRQKTFETLYTHNPAIQGSVVRNVATNKRDTFVFAALMTPIGNLPQTTMRVFDKDTGKPVVGSYSFIQEFGETLNLVISNSNIAFDGVYTGESAVVAGEIGESLPNADGAASEESAEVVEEVVAGTPVEAGETESEVSKTEAIDNDINLEENAIAKNVLYKITVINKGQSDGQSISVGYFVGGEKVVMVQRQLAAKAVEPATDANVASGKSITLILYDLLSGDSIASSEVTAISFLQAGVLSNLTSWETMTADEIGNNYLILDNISDDPFIFNIDVDGYADFGYASSQLLDQNGIYFVGLLPEPDSPALTFTLKEKRDGLATYEVPEEEQAVEDDTVDDTIEEGYYLIRPVKSVVAANYPYGGAYLLDNPNWTNDTVISGVWIHNQAGAPNPGAISGSITEGKITVAEGLLINGVEYELKIYGAPGYYDINLAQTFVVGQMDVEGTDLVVYMQADDADDPANVLQINSMSHIINTVNGCIAQKPVTARSIEIEFNQNIDVSTDWIDLVPLAELVSLKDTGTINYSYDFLQTISGSTVTWSASIDWTDPFAFGGLGYTSTRSGAMIWSSTGTSGGTVMPVALDSGDIVGNTFSVVLSDTDNDGSYNFFSPASEVSNNSALLRKHLVIVAENNKLSISLDEKVDEMLLDVELPGYINVVGKTPIMDPLDSTTQLKNCGLADNDGCYSDMEYSRKTVASYDPDDDLTYDVSKVLQYLRVRSQSWGTTDHWVQLYNIPVEQQYCGTDALGQPNKILAVNGGKLIITENN